uniref:Uncharacterized protein n=1 Tax=Ailuropoda melanoleuca TaxID=9646 RepID=G1L0E6_AILME
TGHRRPKGRHGHGAVFLFVLFTDECGSESQTDHLPRLRLRCYWAPRHHPAKRHSRL